MLLLTSYVGPVLRSLRHPHLHLLPLRRSLFDYRCFQRQHAFTTYYSQRGRVALEHWMVATRSPLSSLGVSLPNFSCYQDQPIQ